MNRERRKHNRHPVLSVVNIVSPTHGEFSCIARNISSGGIFLETRDPLPIGSQLRMRLGHGFGVSQITALGTVKNQYYLHYASPSGKGFMSGMGVRFDGFEDRQKVSDVLTVYTHPDLIH